MTDAAMRLLERAEAAGDPSATSALRVAMQRAGRDPYEVLANTILAIVERRRAAGLCVMSMTCEAKTDAVTLECIGGTVHGRPLVRHRDLTAYETSIGLPIVTHLTLVDLHICERHQRTLISEAGRLRGPRGHPLFGRIVCVKPAGYGSRSSWAGSSPALYQALETP